MSCITVLYGIRQCLFPNCSRLLRLHPYSETVFDGHTCSFHFRFRRIRWQETRVHGEETYSQVEIIWALNRRGREEA